MYLPVRQACQAVPHATSVTRLIFSHALAREVDAVEIEVGFGLQHARADRVGDRARLLEDLLLHEAVVAALLRGDRIPLDRARLAVDRAAVAIEDLHAVLGRARRTRRPRGTASAACRAGSPGCRWPGSSPSRRGRARSGCRRAWPPRCAPDRSPRARRRRRSRPRARVDSRTAVTRSLPASQPLVDQVRDQLGVGIGADRVAARLELGAQLAVVLHDAVVHDHHRARRGAGARCARRACRAWPSACGRRRRCPSSGLVAQHLLEVRELADGAPDRDAAASRRPRRPPSRSRGTRGGAGRRRSPAARVARVPT